MRCNYNCRIQDPVFSMVTTAHEVRKVKANEQLALNSANNNSSDISCTLYNHSIVHVHDCQQDLLRLRTDEPMKPVLHRT